MHAGGGLGENEEGQEERQRLAGGGGHGRGQSSKFFGQCSHTRDAKVATRAKDEQTAGCPQAVRLKEDYTLEKLPREETVDEEDDRAQAVGVEDKLVVRGIIFAECKFLDVDNGGVHG